MTRVLVIAAHSDDEALGCGASMAKHAAAGDEVHVVFLADGVSSRGEASVADIDARNDAALAAAEILGAQPPIGLGLPDNRLDSLPLLDIVQPLEAVIRDVVPDIVYTHHFGDLNVDHRIAHQATLTACRPQPGFSVRAIYGFEVRSATDWGCGGPANAFVPTRYVDVTGFLDKKLAALAAYEKEMRPFPHTRSVEAVEAQARVRGSEVGVAAAEAFTVLRQIA